MRHNTIVSFVPAPWLQAALRNPITRHLLFALAILMLIPIAAAQASDVQTPPDIASWFASAAALAGVVVAAVSFLRAHVLKTIKGAAVLILSLAVGGALGLVGNLLGYVPGGVVAGIGFGLSAGLIASGGWDAVTGLLSKRSAALPEG